MGLQTFPGLCVSVCLSVCQLQLCRHDNASPFQDLPRAVFWCCLTSSKPFRYRMVLRKHKTTFAFFNLRPVSDFGYCHCLHLCVCVCVSVCHVCQSQPCRHYNASPVQARITKFGPEVENPLVKTHIILGGDQPRHPRSNLKTKLYSILSLSES